MKKLSLLITKRQGIMKARDKKGPETPALIEAIATLSHIADLDLDQEIGIIQENTIAHKNHPTETNEPLTNHTIQWIRYKGSDITVNTIKNTFRTILNYLRAVYEKENPPIVDERTIEGIKTIMVLVGDAAKKLDRYTKLFNQAHVESITELKEYKKLQEFYLTHIARKVDEETLGKWILALSNQQHRDKEIQLVGRKNEQSKHVFIDLETVKKDTEYELFFLRKEDGTRFFSPRLIRNAKLVNDFGNFFGETRSREPLLDIAMWQDHFAHTCAKNIFGALRIHIDRFYKEIAHHKHNDFAIQLNNAIMALMLCCNPNNLSHRLPIKNCRDYFHDFQYFLRACLNGSEYRKLIAYPPKKSHKLANCLLHTVHYLCMAMYTQITGLQVLMSPVHNLLQKAIAERSQEHQEAIATSHKLGDRLANDYAALAALLKKHPNGPLNKVLEALEAGGMREYDPLMQGNIPSQLFTLYTQEKKTIIARWPSPTRQEFVHPALIVDEFKGFLQACSHEHVINKCLIFNFQDKTSWKEYSRCLAIEDLPNHESFTKHIDVVTIAKDTEFYHQLTPYLENNHADAFMKHFKEHLIDEGYGNIFPKQMKQKLCKSFIDGVMKGIYQVFFSNRNILLQEHRINFIEIFYLFLQLKIIEISQADIVGYTCKDSLDSSEAAAAQLFIFIKLLNQERLSENDQEQLDLMLYGPCLLSRERIMLPERFNRMLSAVKTIESTKQQIGQQDFAKLIQEVFGEFYKESTLKSKAVVQRSTDIL